MVRTFGKVLSLGLSTLLLGASLALAAGTAGTVTAVDDKGMATVKTADGKEHKVKAGEGWKVGAKVECDAKDGKTECRPVK